MPLTKRDRLDRLTREYYRDAGRFAPGSDEWHAWVERSRELDRLRAEIAAAPDAFPSFSIDTASLEPRP